MNPDVSLVTKVEVATEAMTADGAAFTETMEEIGFMDHCWRRR